MTVQKYSDPRNRKKWLSAGAIKLLTTAEAKPDTPLLERLVCDQFQHSIAGPLILEGIPTLRELRTWPPELLVEIRGIGPKYMEVIATEMTSLGMPLPG